MALVLLTRVSDAPDSERIERIRALHEKRARAELTAAESLAPGSDCVAWSGVPIAEVALVKGCPGPAEASGGAALSGADGEALGKALSALGWSESAVFATLSRSEPAAEPEARAVRLRAQLEAVDPRVVIALDAEAAEDVARAFGTKPLKAGEATRVLGRRLVAIDGFETSLGDEVLKRRVWKQLRAAAPDGPIY